MRQVVASRRMRDLDIALPDHVDERRIEVIADGLPLFHGAQLAIDTTLVSLLSLAWLWSTMLACGGARSFALSLLEFPPQKKKSGHHCQQI